ncbi:MAG TPA: efflux RND transporter periplasmic adaptor subunit [Gemmatimonadales bacterium]|jgi:HlyD family secretion protein|nr:efflux RND transporter periplasmic adaptor subunit [Gemmatimonadales bacterium]
MTGIAASFLCVACKEEAPPPSYQAVPVERRDIVVSAQASGAVQPDTTVEVKSKASGEILELAVETGQTVKRGNLMVRVDPRIPRNAVAQAQADLEVAQARLTNASSQRRRADELFKSQSITEQEHEQALLDYANANAEVIRARVALDNAKDQLDDTNVRAPINGTIIEKQVERGQVISSPTNDVGGGTVLLKMADLNLVQIRTLVDETDIGKIQPEQRATVTVDAYPNRPFAGTVLKIEPQALTEQNVTMFPVLVRIDNKEGLLRPGMNAEVEIHVGRRDDVLAVPNAALRTQRDVGSAAQVLGLSPDEVQKELAAAGQRGSQAAGQDSLRRSSAGSDDGGSLRTRAVGGSTSPAAPQPRGPASRYIVFVKRNGLPAPVWIRTGLTDMDYSEVLQGLTAADSVLVLPSASLVQSQQEMRERFNRVTGGGGVPGMQQQTPQQPSAGTRPQ